MSRRSDRNEQPKGKDKKNKGQEQRVHRNKYRKYEQRKAEQRNEQLRKMAEDAQIAARIKQEQELREMEREINKMENPSFSSTIPAVAEEAQIATPVATVAVMVAEKNEDTAPRQEHTKPGILMRAVVTAVLGGYFWARPLDPKYNKGDIRCPIYKGRRVEASWDQVRFNNENHIEDPIKGFEVVTYAIESSVHRGYSAMRWAHGTEWDYQQEILRQDNFRCLEDRFFRGRPQGTRKVLETRDLEVINKEYPLVFGQLDKLRESERLGDTVFQRRWERKPFRGEWTKCADPRTLQNIPIVRAKEEPAKIKTEAPVIVETPVKIMAEPPKQPSVQFINWSEQEKEKAIARMMAL